MSPTGAAWRATAGLATAGLAAATILAGCGFQLRTWHLDEAFQTARVEADASVDFAPALREALVRAGVAVVEAEADVVLRLTRQIQERRAASVAADARIAEYELALQVEVAGVDRAGAVLIPARVLRVERIARLDRDNLIGASEEEALLAALMRDELAARIVRALDAVAARPGAGASADR